MAHLSQYANGKRTGLSINTFVPWKRFVFHSLKPGHPLASPNQVLIIIHRPPAHSLLSTVKVFSSVL